MFTIGRSLTVLFGEGESDEISRTNSYVELATRQSSNKWRETPPTLQIDLQLPQEGRSALEVEVEVEGEADR